MAPTDTPRTDPDSAPTPAPSTPGTRPRSVLPLLPLPTGVILPQMVVTLALESAEARAAAAGAAGGDGRLLLVPRTAGGGYTAVGTVARVEHEGELPDGQHALRAARRRARLRGRGRRPRPARPVGRRPTRWPRTTCRRAAPGSWRASTAPWCGPSPSGSAVPAWPRPSPGSRSPGALADTAGWSPDLSTERKIQLLEELDPEVRLALALEWAREALGELELTEQIRSRVSEGMDRTQREFMLRQQLRAIREELGETDDEADLVDGYREQLAALDVADDVRDAIGREIDRFDRTSDQSPERGWIRTWLDTVFELPWGARADERLDVADARAVLDADHTGLDEVKDRIVEYLAVRKLRAEKGMHDGRRRRPASPRLGRDPRAGRSARCRQDVTRRVDRAARSAAASCASPSVACTTRPSCVATGAPTSVPAPAASCAR